MKQNTLLVIILFFIFSIQIKSQVYSSDIHKSIDKDLCSDSLCLNFVGNIDGKFEFLLINNSSDNLYLFDSYLTEDSFSDAERLYNAKYLHRFDKKANQCKLSFLPILPYLSVIRDDLYILGENRLVRKGQILYHFRIIAPNIVYHIKIPEEAFYQQEYVREFYPKKLSKFEKNIKIKDITGKNCNSIIVEFALYKNIDIVNNADAYYYNEFEFNKQALSYDIASVLVSLR